jgi:carbonic anhydrase
MTAKTQFCGVIKGRRVCAMPNVKAITIGCANMHVDPAYVLSGAPGAVVVIRNIGGRVTPGSLQQQAANLEPIGLRQ